MKWFARLAAFSAALPPESRLRGGAVQGLTSAAAAIIAYLPSRPLGLHEGFWGSITAVSVVQSEFSVAETSARDQFTGAAIGGLVGAGVVATLGQTLATYALAVVISVMACWILQMASAARMAGSTATIIVLVPHQSALGWTLASRVGEVGWGVSVALATVWLVGRISRTR